MFLERIKFWAFLHFTPYCFQFWIWATPPRTKRMPSHHSYNPTSQNYTTRFTTSTLPTCYAQPTHWNSPWEPSHSCCSLTPWWEWKFFTCSTASNLKAQLLQKNWFKNTEKKLILKKNTITDYLKFLIQMSYLEKCSHRDGNSIYSITATTLKSSYSAHSPFSLCCTSLWLKLSWLKILLALPYSSTQSSASSHTSILPTLEISMPSRST